VPYAVSVDRARPSLSCVAVRRAAHPIIEKRNSSGRTLHRGADIGSRSVRAGESPTTDQILLGENLQLLPRFADGSFQLIYIDPPFNTGRAQVRKTLSVVRDGEGERTGFQGRRYRTQLLAESSYRDSFDDYLGFLEPRLQQARRLLREDGTLYFHIDYREAHHCKLLLDEIFGREQFLNELIWAYDYGARAKRRWPAKHDTILVYVKDAARYYFDSEAVDREPYMAPGLVSAEKAARGKLPTDVWWHTIVPTNGAEKTGYPTQKPEGIVRRMLQASTRPGDWCLDFFAGSGTLGAVAAKLQRRYVLIDSSAEAVRVMRERLSVSIAPAAAVASKTAPRV
jgi:site-specific DNA-methyltransferase (adenine-specific)